MNLIIFSQRHPRIGRWVMPQVDNCTGKHLRASWLLWRMGTNAQAAIPDVIDCLENCHSMHVTSDWDLLDTLGEISGTNPAAIPFLTKCACRDDSLTLRAAAIAYRINAQTNLLIETCKRLTRNGLNGLLDGPELIEFENDRQLNQQLVPLLEELYLDPKLNSRDRSAVIDALESRTNDPSAVLFCAHLHQN